MSADGSTKAIVAALFANGGIAIAKFVGFAITGASSMLAEAVHSVADTSNQGLLLLGQKQARREPTALHQFGYGRNRYFYSFIVALVLFTLGSMFALYEGIHKIQHPEGLKSPFVAIAILVVAIALEGYSLRTAVRESRPLKRDKTWWQFIRTSRNPELPVVLLEDAGAMVGLVLALGGVGMTMLTDNGVWDGAATICIGLLLGVIAIILIIEMQSLLLGESATAKDMAIIVRELAADDVVERVIHCRTQYLAPEEILVAAKIAVSAGTTLADVSTVTDRMEERIRSKVPHVGPIYVEAALDTRQSP